VSEDAGGCANTGFGEEFETAADGRDTTPLSTSSSVVPSESSFTWTTTASSVMSEDS